MRRRVLNLVTALSLALFLGVLAGTLCHLLFHPRQRSVLEWTTDTHEYSLGFKVFGVQFARVERWPPRGGGAVGTVRSIRVGNALLMYMRTDLVDSGGATARWTVVYSFGLPLTVPLVLPALWLVRYRRRRRRRIAGACPSCGYDLRASPGRCPECGVITPSLATRNVARSTT